MLVVLAVVIILSAVCVYAIDRIEPGWLRIQAGKFRIEMGQSGDRPPREERRELGTGRDKPKELEAGREHGDSGRSDAAEQGNAAA